MFTMFAYTRLSGWSLLVTCYNPKQSSVLSQNTTLKYGRKNNMLVIVEIVEEEMHGALAQYCNSWCSQCLPIFVCLDGLSLWFCFKSKYYIKQKCLDSYLTCAKDWSWWHDWIRGDCCSKLNGWWPCQSGKIFSLLNISRQCLTLPKRSLRSSTQYM